MSDKTLEVTIEEVNRRLRRMETRITRTMQAQGMDITALPEPHEAAVQVTTDGTGLYCRGTETTIAQLMMAAGVYKLTGDVPVYLGARKVATLLR